MAYNAKKSIIDSEDDLLLPELSNAKSKFKCDICGVTFTDRKSEEAHLVGKKHEKKVKEIGLKSKKKVVFDKTDNGDEDSKFKSKKKIVSDKTDSGDEDSDEDSGEDSDDSKQIYCETCDKYVTGSLTYRIHVKGKGHAKNLKKLKLKKKFDNMPEVIKKENKEKDSDDDDDDDTLTEQYAKCEICKKQFNGPESLRDHQASKKHLNKVKQAKDKKDLNNGEGEHSDGEEKFRKCDTCKKTFSGHIPYNIHMLSNVHKRNLEKQKMAEEIKEFCANTDFNEGYVCKECKKTFTDPMAFKSHLQNNSHDKQKAKAAISDFLNAYPEIVYVTPDDKEAGKNGSDEEMYYLICKVCKISFSGPESAKDHVKSKKHNNTKREEMMKKQLKERQKTSIKASNSNTDAEQSFKESSIDKQIETKFETKNDIDEFEVI